MKLQMMETIREKLLTVVETLFDKEVIELNNKFLDVIHKEVDVKDNKHYIKIFVHTMALASVIRHNKMRGDIANRTLVEMLSRDN